MPRCDFTTRQYRRVAAAIGIRHPMPKSCDRLTQAIAQPCELDDYRISAYLGGDKDGHVVSALNPHGGRLAIKIMDKDDGADEAAAIQQSVALTSKLAPHVRILCRKGRSELLVMEHMDGVLDTVMKQRRTHAYLDVIIEKVIYLMQALHGDMHVTHGDLHWGNIGYVNGMELMAIDFSNAYESMSVDGVMAHLDLIQLLRTAFREYNKWHDANCDYMTRKLYDLYMEWYAAELPPNGLAYDVDAIDDEFHRLSDIHEARLP